MNWTKEQPFQALCLTGGGYRGLFTAKALATIEGHIGHPIGRHFDLACGTSIGGIIALAVAFEKPMSDVVKVFQKRGLEIFPPYERPTTKLGGYTDLWRHSHKPRYSTKPLRETLEEIFPNNPLLGDAIHPVAIPAVNLTEGKPQVFKTRHKIEWTRDYKYPVIDIALATSAAPTFFELAQVGTAWYADGGLFANAPDLIAMHEAEYFFNVAAEYVRILSVGTTSKSYSISFGAGRQFGISEWMEDERLFSVTLS